VSTPAGGTRPDGPARPRVLVVVHEDGAGLGRLEPPIAEAADLEVRQAQRGDRVPTDLGGYRGLVVLGGSMAAVDDDVAPWLPATRRLLAAGVESGVPTLGICLGAQLLAVATGGRVERGAAGLEVGVVPVRLLPDADDDLLLGPWARRLGGRPPTAQFHEDAITELPPGAVPLAVGDRYPHQAFRLGERAWGVQYHPEVTTADFMDWLRDGHGSLQAAGLDGTDLASDYTAAETDLATLAIEHATAFADLVCEVSTTPLR
jgi:GMP synthase-like glutamine amidotransferase